MYKNKASYARTTWIVYVLIFDDICVLSPCDQPQKSWLAIFGMNLWDKGPGRVMFPNSQLPFFV